MTGHGKTHLAEEILSQLHGKVPVVIIDSKSADWELTYPGAPVGEVVTVGRAKRPGLLVRWWYWRMERKSRKAAR